MPYPSPLLASLGTIVQEAGALAVRLRRGGVQRELKPDGSIVTTADRAVEEWLRTELPDLFPDTNVWGEELGFEQEGEGGLWLVDPIDGTTNYSFGSPLWGVSVALLRNGHLELGAITLPDLHETYLGERGRGAFCNGQSLPQIPAGTIRPEEIVSRGENLIRDFPNAEWPGKSRSTGAFVIEGTFMVRQRYRGLVGYGEKLYDIAAAMLFGLESGAEIRYADGGQIILSDLVTDEKINRPWIMFPAESGFILK